MMLKFLTHKLRTHSLNEENVSEKVEERDSGTESDDEADRLDSDSCAGDVTMKWDDITDISVSREGCVCAGAPGERGERGADADTLYDHHSSEEELEVINGAPKGEGGGGAGGAGGRRRGASSPPPAAPEKRKWPDYDEAARPPSDDDDLTKVETPVRFRTSPPLEAVKPRAPPPRAPPSPRRKRHPHAHHPHAHHAPRRHRPALDFDKMQQLKAESGVRSWRGGAGGAPAGELSVFCW